MLTFQLSAFHREGCCTWSATVSSPAETKEGLPYGWDEAYTANGAKYYINHVTQTTSWTHPVMNSLGLSEPDANKPTQNSPESKG
ncbi:hypothetical protein AMELA_G00112140 [Ameiurus melas]|uniref:WW domain-containing protein n=1 Tax=Ameiurus melas TaxID=219545 RepID=A0A7J6AS75_AMEME|nr:hypothetical protein AMELA_G00112140 [Ameiurus melas]